MPSGATARPPPRALVRVSIVVALSLLGDQLLYAVLPVMHEAMGIPVTAVGLILSANRLVRLVTNSLSGYVIDRFGRRWPFIGSLLLGGMTTIAYGGVRGVWIFLLARLLWGTAWSFLRIEGLSTAQLKRRRPRPGDTWHLDEVFVTINGQRHYLWRGEPSIRTTISSIS